MFKKFTKTVAILGAIMITLGVTTPAQAASCGTGKTTATVNVRTGASTKYRKIGKLSKGKKVNLYTTKNGWYKIKFNENTVGLAKNMYLNHLILQEKKAQIA